jgi:hypothetical protein
MSDDIEIGPDPFEEFYKRAKARVARRSGSSRVLIVGGRDYAELAGIPWPPPDGERVLVNGTWCERVAIIPRRSVSADEWEREALYVMQVYQPAVKACADAARDGKGPIHFGHLLPPPQPPDDWQPDPAFRVAPVKDGATEDDTGPAILREITLG